MGRAKRAKRALAREPVVKGLPAPLRSWRPWVLLIATVAAFAPSINGDLLWDDAIIPMIARRSPGDFWFSLSQPDYWPVTYTLIWCVSHLSDDSSFAFHSLNLVIHVANVYLWWRVLQQIQIELVSDPTLNARFDQARWIAVALFALHPIQVEAVSYVFQIKTTLALTFFLLAFDSYLRSLSSNETSNRKYLGALLFFAAACLAKTSAVMLPAALVLAHCVHGRASFTRSTLLRLIPFFLVSCGSAALSSMTSAKNTQNTAVWDATWAERTLTAGYNAWFYVGKALYPESLSVAYPKIVLNPGQVASYVPIVAWLVLLAVFFRFRRGLGGVFLVGALFYLSQILPVLGFANIFFMKWSLVADHWAYLAVMGIFFPISVLVTCVPERFRKVARVGIGIVFVALFLATMRHSFTFRSASALWEHTLQENPQADIAYTSLGVTAYQARDFERALELYEDAVRVQPSNDEAQFGVATALRALDRNAEARPYLERTVAINPRHAKAFNELGSLELAARNYQAAERNFKRAIEIDPNIVEAYGNLSLLFRQQDRLEDALRFQTRAGALAPNDDRVLVNLGSLLIELERWDEAEDALDRAVDLNPRQAAAYFNLAQIYSRDSERESDAIAALRRGLQLQPENTAAQRMLEQLQSASDNGP